MPISAAYTTCKGYSSINQKCFDRCGELFVLMDLLIIVNAVRLSELKQTGSHIPLQCHHAIIIRFCSVSLFLVSEARFPDRSILFVVQLFDRSIFTELHRIARQLLTNFWTSLWSISLGGHSILLIFFFPTARSPVPTSQPRPVCTS